MLRSLKKKREKKKHLLKYGVMSSTDERPFFLTVKHFLKQIPLSYEKGIQIKTNKPGILVKFSRS